MYENHFYFRSFCLAFISLYKDDHVLEGRRSQGGLNPNSVQIDLFGAGNVK